MTLSSCLLRVNGVGFCHVWNTILIPDELLSRRNIALKYFSSDRVFNELVNGEVTREVIYASMNVARKRKYAEREKLFADALARFDEYRKEKTK